MLKTVSKSLWLPILALLLSACGNMPEAGGNQHESHTITDNRTEYLIQNRIGTNEYLESGMESNSKMDTRAYDERARAGTSGQALQAAQYQVEQAIRDRVLGLSGVKDTEVHLLGTTVTIRVQAADGANKPEVERKVQEQIRLLYNYEVEVVSY